MSKKPDSETDNHLIPSLEDELDKLMRGLLEIRQRYDNISLDPALILELIDKAWKFRSNFERGTSDPDNFFTLADIEARFQNYQRELLDLEHRNLQKMVANLKGEAGLVKKKRKNSKKKE